MRTKLIFAALVLGTLPMSSCATVAGTAASPLTGGVDAATVYVGPNQWYWIPLAFLGGTIGAPFVAFYNGINYDAEHLTSGASYWHSFGDNFRPYRMLRANM